MILLLSAVSLTIGLILSFARTDLRDGIWRAWLGGAFVGWLLAGAGFVLITLRPFSMGLNGLIEKLTVHLCPLSFLFFWPNPLHLGMASTAIAVVVGNGLIYGTLVCPLGGVMRLHVKHPT